MHFTQINPACYVYSIVTDYSNLPVGTKLGRGEIKECPYCKRIGLVRDVDGKLFVTHIEGILPNPQKLPEIIDDECPKEGTPLLSADSA